MISRNILIGVSLTLLGLANAGEPYKNLQMEKPGVWVHDEVFESCTNNETKKWVANPDKDTDDHWKNLEQLAPGVKDNLSWMSHERVVFRFKHDLDSGYSFLSTAGSMVGLPTDWDSLKFWDDKTAYNTMEAQKKDPRNAIYYCRPKFRSLTAGEILISPNQITQAAYAMFNKKKSDSSNSVEEEDDDNIAKKAVEMWDGASYKHPFRYVKSNRNVNHSYTTFNFRIKDIKITATQVRMKVVTGSNWAGCRTNDRHIEKPWDHVTKEGGFKKDPETGEVDEDEKAHFMTVLRYIKFMYVAMEAEDKALYWVTKRCPVRFDADRAFSKLDGRKHWRIIKTCIEVLKWTDDFALGKVFGFLAVNNYHRYNET